MASQAGHPAPGERRPQSPGDAGGDFRRLLVLLAARARRFGSRDPEAAAQEALKRSVENARSRPAIEYYFGEHQAAGAEPPEWPLDQLFAWLHGVLRYVVREEHHRASSRREISMSAIGPELRDEGRTMDPADPERDQLDALLRKERQEIVAGCFPMIDREYQTVLRMRVNGLKYGEIATRLGISENTVATWVSRGIGALAQHVRRRMERVISLPRSSGEVSGGK